ncbi:MAG: beta-ketoacyl-ACP reductase [Nannocystis sp.]|uniref:beta-ketoacyl-ACP reductase n=1 Tax=Nannocystis sp. TaxID=1962667 RepID=UPI0024270BC9|nr:beta-ketoacyl-ACP reductase [Nannocystis sp.]MBK9753472.1 beta-ketoacyl-ACP reductase [Nannocystis sp.]
MTTASTPRVAVVTGGGSGIGRATALLFAESGYAVAIWDMSEQAGHDTLQAITAAGGVAVFHRVDVSQASSTVEAAAGVRAQFGRVDVLINNAGIVRDAQLVKVRDGKVVAQMSEEQFDAVVNVNLKGVFNCTQSVVPTMIEQRYGRIVSTSSVVGLYGNFGQTNYVAAKAGVIGMTKVWARELGKYNITANAVAPGFIATEMVKSIPEKVMQHMIEHTPVGRVGQPEDIARAYLFLADERSSFITGAVLSVDGGSVTGT